MSPVRRPDKAALRRLASQLCLEVPEADLDAYLSLVDWGLRSVDEMAELASQEEPGPPPQREYSHPDPAENDLGAWYVRASIQEADTGPLAGRSVVIKDSIAVAGLPMANGSAVLEGYIPSADATVVQRVLRAGGTIVGKAVCESFCASAASHTAYTGPVRNPYDLGRSSGGSSSGSAALVADRQVDMSIGSDQGGSVRGPSSWSGIYGLKPTYGLVPCTGAFPVEMTLDHLGPMAASVTDVALLLDVIAGADPDDPRQPPSLPTEDYSARLRHMQRDFRIGVLEEGFGLSTSEEIVDEMVRAAIGRLRDLGMPVEQVSVPWHRHGAAIWAGFGFEGVSTLMFHGESVGNNWRGRYPLDILEGFSRLRRERPDGFPPTAVMQGLTGQWLHEQYHGNLYARAQNLGRRMSAMYDEVFANIDILVLPTTPMRAAMLPEGDDIIEIVHKAMEAAPTMMPFNISGHPAMNIPCGLADGLPVGLMAVGRRWEEGSLLAFAKLFEEEIYAPEPPPPRQ